MTTTIGAPTPTAAATTAAPAPATAPRTAAVPPSAAPAQPPPATGPGPVPCGSGIGTPGGPGDGVAPRGGTVLVATCPGDGPDVLPPWLVVVLPGGFRMSGGPAPAPPPVRAAATPPAAPTGPTGPGAGSAPPDAARVRSAAVELVRVVTEVLAGRRPPATLTAVTAPPVRRYLAAARSVPPARPPRGRAGPGGRARAPGCATPRRPPRVHVAHPAPDAAEVCATVTVAGRLRALALRLDRAPDGRWLATAVRLL
ncbi:Rv3235 family protein [Pseudonocardia spirodelae]|uniref:Rv3235 family protein n=1 Tax=Pseudonocardia spirodelae TaxID=3133431 RepID=A0ABU8TCU4_9PSEU